MTRMIRFRFRRLVLVAAASTGAVALALGTAAAASAGTPTPTPTPTVTTPAPSPSPSPLRLRPEAFIIQISTANPGGTVFATGPVRGRGTDQTVNPVTDIFRLTGLTGSVRVLHSRIGTPVVDLRTCTASLAQTGRWVILGRSGAFARAFGFGTFRLSERVILARGLFGRCLPRARPLWFDVQVLGTGRAALLRLGLRAPHVSPALLPVS